MLKVGDKAPDFTLKNQDGKDVTLSDYLGNKVVVYFYPKDNTPGCTTQACGFRDANDDLKDKGVIVLGISKDSIASHRKFYENKRLNFDILSDENMDAIKAYGLWKEKSVFGKLGMGVSRSTFVIDADGVIEKVFEKASTKSNAEDVLEYLNS